MHSSKVQKQPKKQTKSLFLCFCFVTIFLEAVTNHTGRINLQVQSSYKSKISQKYASLLYIANVYLYFLFPPEHPKPMLQKTTRPRLSAMETQAASPPLRCIIVYKTRSRVWLFLFFCSFLQYNPGVLVFLSSSSSHLLIPLPYFTTRWLQSVNIETERVALLQTCRSMEPPAAS